MKKVALFGLFLSLLFAQVSFAAYEFTAGSATPTTIVASLGGVGASESTFQLFILNKPFKGGESYTARSGGFADAAGLWPASETNKKAVSGKVEWNLGGLKSGTTYYARVVEIPLNNTAGAFYATDQKIVTTKDASITPDELEFNYDNGALLIKGRLNPTTHPDHSTYDIKIQVSQEAFTLFTETYPPKYSVYPGHTTTTITTAGTDADGKYYVFIPNNIGPGKKYNIRQTIRVGGTEKIVDGIYNSGAGYTPSTATNIQNDFEDRSYRLLAPLPGLHVFLDPDLCAERAAAENTEEVCDINDFLNLGFKILIGAAAVLLVLRIMFEGYKYITTDIPALKTSAKSGLKDAVLGLVLALSSFLILNTINPKLVENTVNVDRLEIGVLVDEEDSAPTLTAPSGAVPSGKIAACTLGVEKVTVSGVSFWACKSISTKFKNMLSAANVAGFKLSGGGFRTQQEQIALRKKNCGEANVYKTNAICSPKTAPPGTSRHESGLAFDLQCNGKLINFDKQNPGMGIHPETKACFEWLTRNAGTYGLKNLKGENWHWSVDGK